MSNLTRTRTAAWYSNYKSYLVDVFASGETLTAEDVAYLCALVEADGARVTACRPEVPTDSNDAADPLPSAIQRFDLHAADVAELGAATFIADGDKLRRVTVPKPGLSLCDKCGRYLLMDGRCRHCEKSVCPACDGGGREFCYQPQHHTI